ncbi:MAG TPA: hypothetical protein VMF91_23495 [Bryobacteraceae bacterium]|nr:hypothetical protein [Bryobacteraceae bacterium]
MKTILALLLTIGLLSIAGCTSSKELNERTARTLLKEWYAKVHYPIPVSIIAPLMTRVPASYGSVMESLQAKQVKENVAVYIVKRLTDAKLVTERVDTVMYPNIHGRFRSDNRYDYDEYDLTMVADSNRISGTRYQQCQNCANQHQSKVNGIVNENGLVTLPNGRFRYKEDGAVAYLLDTDRFNVTNYKGTTAGPPVAVKWYSYSFSPELQSQIEKTQVPTFGFGSNTEDTLNGGSYQIGQVSDLQLGMSPTVASASFAWTVDLNKIGKLFFGSEVPAGKGRVTFVRKPDETWAIKDWCVANCWF